MSVSEIRGKVGPWDIAWESVPRGPQGSAWARVAKAGGPPKRYEVRWKRDADGLWLELPDGVHGFDFRGTVNDDGRLQYEVVSRLRDAQWSGLAFLRSGDEAAQASAGAKKKGTRIRAQMPGKIVRVLVKSGAAVERGQPLLVMEAMKMENEIRAPQAGVVATVKVSEGQAVDSGADLMSLE